MKIEAYESSDLRIEPGKLVGGSLEAGLGGLVKLSGASIM